MSRTANLLAAAREDYIAARQLARDHGFDGNFKVECEEELGFNPEFASPREWIKAARTVAAEAVAHLQAQAECAAEEAAQYVNESRFEAEAEAAAEKAYEDAHWGYEGPGITEPLEVAYGPQAARF